MPGIAGSDGSAAANGAPPDDGTATRAFDCTDPIHETAHITAETADVLIEKVLRHFAQYHPELGEQAVRELVVAAAYVESAGAEDDDDLVDALVPIPPPTG